MQTKHNFSSVIQKFEHLTFFLFSLSIFISKAGLNIALVLALILMIVKTLTQPEFKAFLTTNKVARLSLICFVVGLIAGLLSPSHLKGMGNFFNKAGFLLIFPLFIFHFSNAKNRRYAIIAMLAGFAIALLYSLSLFLSFDHWRGQRVASFWTVGRWAELLIYMSLLCVVWLTKRKNNTWEYLALLATLIVAVFCIAINGSRAAFLALGLILPVYFLFNKKKVILPAILFGFIATVAVYFVAPSVVKQAETRIVSITDTEKNMSNTARLTSWKEGILFQLKTIEEEPITYMTGYGVNGFDQQLKQFLIDKGIFQHLMESTDNQFSYNDHHNGLLNIISTSGIVYSAIFVYLLVVIFKSLPGDDCWLVFCRYLMMTFLLVSIFYTNFMDFQTIGVFFMLAIGLGIQIEQRASEDNGIQ
jgi:O-antigen ligase